MNRLSECRFTHAGQDLQFTVFSDNIVSTKLDAVVTMPLVGQAELYRLEPSRGTHWVSVVEKRDGKESERSWALDHGEFVQVSEPTELARIKALTAAIRARRDKKWRRFRW